MKGKLYDIVAGLSQKGLRTIKGVFGKMPFKNKVVVVTGGAQGIGRCCAECFEREGATVHVIDVKDGPWFVGDISDKATLERFAARCTRSSSRTSTMRFPRAR